MDRTTKIMLGVAAVGSPILFAAGVLTGIVLAGARPATSPVAAPVEQPVRLVTAVRSAAKLESRPDRRKALIAHKSAARRAQAEAARRQLEGDSLDVVLTEDPVVEHGLTAAEIRLIRRRNAEAVLLEAESDRYDADVLEDDRRELAGLPRLKTHNQIFAPVDPQAAGDPFAPSEPVVDDPFD